MFKTPIPRSVQRLQASKELISEALKDTTVKEIDIKWAKVKLEQENVYEESSSNEELVPNITVRR